MFIKHFAARAGASWIGKALPFGIGAVIGGAGNGILGRRVVVSARRAFGPAPLELPADLADARDQRIGRRLPALSVRLSVRRR
jgi:hypothetical protein